MKYLYLITLFFCFTSCQNYNVEQSCFGTSEKVDVIHGLEIDLCVFYNDMEQSIKYSAETGKPILTIYGCWACMGDPDAIWRNIIDKEVYNLIRYNYIISYLYVDDNLLLNKIDKSELDYKNKPIKTIGHRNWNRQIVKYGNGSQPYYTITNSNDEDLVEPIGYIPPSKMNIFIDFIKNGLAAN